MTFVETFGKDTLQRCARLLASPLPGTAKRCRRHLPRRASSRALPAAPARRASSRVSGLRARVHGLHSPQIHAIDPLRVHFSRHGLGEYEACQAELLALLALNPSSRGVGQGATGADGVQAVSDHLFIRPVETRPVEGILGAVSPDDEHK